MGKGVLDEVAASLEHISALLTLVLPLILLVEQSLQLFHLESLSVSDLVPRRFSQMGQQIFLNLPKESDTSHSGLSVHPCLRIEIPSFQFPVTLLPIQFLRGFHTWLSDEAFTYFLYIQVLVTKASPHILISESSSPCLQSVRHSVVALLVWCGLGRSHSDSLRTCKK